MDNQFNQQGNYNQQGGSYQQGNGYQQSNPYQHGNAYQQGGSYQQGNGYGNYNGGVEAQKAPNIFQQFAYSFVPNLYDRLAKVKTGSMIGFVTLLVLAATLLSFVSVMVSFSGIDMEEIAAQLPEFVMGTEYSLFYPRADHSAQIQQEPEYEELAIVNHALSMGEIAEAGSMIVDGILAERRK